MNFDEPKCLSSDNLKSRSLEIPKSQKFNSLNSQNPYFRIPLIRKPRSQNGNRERTYKLIILTLLLQNGNLEAMGESENGRSKFKDRIIIERFTEKTKRLKDIQNNGDNKKRDRKNDVKSTSLCLLYFINGGS